MKSRRRVCLRANIGKWRKYQERLISGKPAIRRFDETVKWTTASRPFVTRDAVAL
ncbi:hypothetical protein D9M68_287210 [compost metagenome]